MALTYVLKCPEQCSLKPGSQVGTQVSEWLIEGRKYLWIVAEVKARYDYTLYPSVLTSHKRHITITGEKKDSKEQDDRHKVNNIEILEAIIEKGFQNSNNWKPTISDTMKAMDMWFRLTQGNPFDDLLDTLASAALGEGMNETNEAAIGLPDERAQAAVVEEGDLEPAGA